jgi:iron complex transport system substrate-binding protein
VIRWILPLSCVFAVACAAHRTAPPVHRAQPRIVSLMPSLTEDLCALGAGRQLAGVSQFSQDIPCARGVPQVNNFASVDSEMVIRLRPDVVVGIDQQRLMTAPLRAAGITTQFYADDRFADLFTDIQGLGAVSGHRASAQKLIRALHARTAALVAGERFKRRPSVFFLEQAVPIWTVGPGSYIGELIGLAGGRLATASLAQPYAQYNAEALVRLDPDVIVATRDARLPGVLESAPWRSLRAVREHHVYILQNAALLVRPGPRYNEGLSWLIERLRPLAR